MFTKFRNPYTEDKVFDIQKGFINILHDICELNEIPDTISEICETVISDIGKQTSFTDSIINAHNAFNDREYTAMLNREYHLQEIQRANRVISLVAEGLSFDYSVFAVIRGKDGSYKIFETPCLKLDKLCETFNHNVSKACTIQIFFEQHRKDYFRNVEKENFSLFWTLTETESLTSPIRSFTGYQIEIASTF